jgi:hypothetical protein
MGLRFWRREESLQQQLAREGGMEGDLSATAPEPIDTRGPLEVGITGLAQTRRWDVVVTTEAEGPPLDSVHFVALADGTLVVDEEVPDGTLAPLAEAVESELTAPYRVEGIRRGEGVWALAASRIEVITMTDEVNGDDAVFTCRGSERTLVVDGETVLGVLPTLEQLGRDRAGDGFTVEASRIDGTLWEVRVDPL